MTLSEDIEKIRQDKELAFYKVVARDNYGVNADDCDDVECVIKIIHMHLAFKFEEEIQQLREDLRNKYKKMEKETEKETHNEIYKNTNNLTYKGL